MAKNTNTTADGFTPSKAMTDAQIDQVVRRMGDEVKNQPRVKVRLPINPYDPSKEPQFVGINGYFLYIPRGVEVEVPQSIVDILVQQGAM